MSRRHMPLSLTKPATLVDSFSHSSHQYLRHASARPKKGEGLATFRPWNHIFHSYLFPPNHFCALVSILLFTSNHRFPSVCLFIYLFSIHPLVIGKLKRLFVCLSLDIFDSSAVMEPIRSCDYVATAEWRPGKALVWLDISDIELVEGQRISSS